MARDYGLTHLFVEPSGFVIPRELHTQIAVAGRTTRLEVGPIVLLLDGTQPDAPLDEDVRHITMQQAAQADVVAVNKLDTADLDEVAGLESALEELAPGVTLHKISLFSGEGMENLLAAVFSDGERR
jgi:G3E family GTPase